MSEYFDLLIENKNLDKLQKFRKFKIKVFDILQISENIQFQIKKSNVSTYPKL